MGKGGKKDQEQKKFFFSIDLLHLKKEQKPNLEEISLCRSSLIKVQDDSSPSSHCVSHQMTAFYFLWDGGNKVNGTEWGHMINTLLHRFVIYFFKEIELLSYKSFSQLTKGSFLAHMNLFVFYSNASRFHTSWLKHMKRNRKRIKKEK